MKRNLCKHQQEQIKSLEEMIDYLHDSFLHIVKLSEKIDSSTIKTPDLLAVPKPIILKPFTPRPTSKNMYAPRGSVRVFPDHWEKTPELSICGSYVDTDSLEPSNLAMKTKALETSLEMQRLYNTELKRSNEINKNQSITYQKLLKEFEQKIIIAQKQERDRWKLFFSELKIGCEKELARKQVEVIKLNKLLGE
mmetsp:Transcript_7714/g.7567  ORF Transcript_7714/g.7567 Transcript_7714/m.7567 type:complete len:194 (+) Transcript_7714:75-656(+)